MCRRAWARAQFYGLTTAVEEMQRHWSAQKLVFGTVVPHGILFTETNLHRLRVADLQSQFRDALARSDVVIRYRDLRDHPGARHSAPTSLMTHPKSSRTLNIVGLEI
jgi:hypothetical protein